MTDTLQRYRFNAAQMPRAAKAIEKVIHPESLFALVVFDNHPHATPGGYSNYISSGQREQMIRALRECADTLEAKLDVAPGSDAVAASKATH